MHVFNRRRNNYVTKETIVLLLGTALESSDEHRPPPHRCMWADNDQKQVCFPCFKKTTEVELVVGQDAVSLKRETLHKQNHLSPRQPSLLLYIVSKASAKIQGL